MNPTSKSPDSASFGAHAIALLALVCSVAPLLFIEGCGGSSSSGGSQAPPPPVPASITATAGSGQSATVSTAFATNLGAIVKDSLGNLVANVSVTFTAPSNGASGAFANGMSTTMAITNGSGVATASAFTANGTTGSYTVVASVSGVNSTAAFNLTNSPQATPVSITSLDKTVADPFTLITVSGSGFEQGTLAISVLFIPENGNTAILIPASASSPTTVQAIIPPLIDTSSETIASGVVDVEIVEFSNAQTFISNRISGLQINTLPSVPAGVPVGAMTAAFLVSGLNVSASMQSAEMNNPNFSNLIVALSQSDADNSALISSIGIITQNPTQTVQLTLANQATATLNANMLTLSDQLVQAMIGAIINAGPIPSTPPSPSCPPSTNNPTFDGELCSAQIFFQSLAVPSSPVTTHSLMSNATSTTVQQAADKALLNLIIAGIATAVPGGLAVEIGVGLLGSYISTAVTTGTTPGGTDNIGTVGTTVLDHYAFRGNPVTGTLLDVVEVVKAAASDAPAQPGIVLSSGVAVSIPGGGTAVTYLDSNGNPTATLVKVPANAPQEMIDTTQLVIPPPPMSKLTVSVQGSGTGSVVSFPEGISCGTSCSSDFPTGTTVGLTAKASSGSSLGSWSGACSGSQGCPVQMTADETVTATFSPSSSGPPPLMIPGPQGLTGCVDPSNGQGSVDAETLVAFGGTPLSGYSWTLQTGSTFPPGTTVDALTGVFHSNGAAPTAVATPSSIISSAMR